MNIPNGSLKRAVTAAEALASWVSQTEWSLEHIGHEDESEAKRARRLHEAREHQAKARLQWQPRWDRFVSQLQEGDELWAYSSPAEAWRHLHGEAGYAILRDGKVIDKWVTLEN